MGVAATEATAAITTAPTAGGHQPGQRRVWLGGHSSTYFDMLSRDTSKGAGHHWQLGGRGAGGGRHRDGGHDPSGGGGGGLVFREGPGE